LRGAPGGLAAPAAERLHGRPVVFEESDASEGIWSVSIEKSDGIYVYAIPLSKIYWRIDGNSLSSDLTRCPEKFIIDFNNLTPSVSFE
jgi:hypothetical protein